MPGSYPLLVFFKTPLRVGPYTLARLLEMALLKVGNFAEII